MDEAQVKALALSAVRQAYGRRPKPVVTAEFTLGSSGVRADLAVFGRTTIGFEIKTAQDSLRRLPYQTEAYGKYFNQAVVIAASCHVRNITDEHLHGAALWEYGEDGVLTHARDWTNNAVSPWALDDLLTKAERRHGDFERAMDSRYSKTSQHFWQTVERRDIRADDLSLLSRFAASREQARQMAAERDRWWARWRAAQQAAIPSLA